MKIQNSKFATPQALQPLLLSESTYDLEALPLEKLDALQQEIKAVLHEARRQKRLIDGALSLKLMKQTRAQLKAQGFDAGIVRFLQEGYEVVADVRLKVIWDQEFLKKIDDQLPEKRIYAVHTRRWIPENNYDEWPKSLKALVEPARRRVTGNVYFRVVRQEIVNEQNATNIPQTTQLIGAKQ